MDSRKSWAASLGASLFAGAVPVFLNWSRGAVAALMVFAGLIALAWGWWAELQARWLKLKAGQQRPSAVPKHADLVLLKRTAPVPPRFLPTGHVAPPTAYALGERFGLKAWQVDEWTRTGAFVRIDREVALKDLGQAIVRLEAVLDRLIANSSPPDEWEWGAALEEFGASIGAAARFDKSAARAARKLRKIYASLREEMQGNRRLPRFRQAASALEGWGRRFPASDSR